MSICSTSSDHSSSAVSVWVLVSLVKPHCKKRHASEISHLSGDVLHGCVCCKQAPHPARHKLVIGNIHCNLLFCFILISFKWVSEHPSGRAELRSSWGSFLGFPQVNYGTASSCPHLPMLRLTVLDWSTAQLLNILHLSSPHFIQMTNIHPFSQASAAFSGFFSPLVSLKPQTSFFLAPSRFSPAFEVLLKSLSWLLPFLALLTSHDHQPPRETSEKFAIYSLE